MSEKPGSISSSRLPELDGLRALAILLVLFSHQLSSVPVPWVRWLTEKGWVGVDLFFVLSGFLIGGILLDNRNATNYYGVFYERRFLRIVPLYALLVLPGILVVITGLQKHFGGHSMAGQSALGMWLCVFFLQNLAPMFQVGVPAYLGPTWSVAVEEQFYLLLPPVIRNVSRMMVLNVLLVAIGLAPIFRGVIVWMGGEGHRLLCYVLLPCRWDSLLLGVLAALVYREPMFLGWIRGRRRWLQMTGALLFVISLGLLLSSNRHLDAFLAFLGYTVIDAAFACILLLAVLYPDSLLHRGLSWKFWGFIAAISYGLYLLQSPMMAIMDTVFHQVLHVQCAKISWMETGIGMVSLGATFLAAAISWRFFESRIIKMGHQHRYNNQASSKDLCLAERPLSVKVPETSNK